MDAEISWIKGSLSFGHRNCKARLFKMANQSSLALNSLISGPLIGPTCPTLRFEYYQQAFCFFSPVDCPKIPNVAQLLKLSRKNNPATWPLGKQQLIFLAKSTWQGSMFGPTHSWTVQTCRWQRWQDPRTKKMRLQPNLGLTGPFWRQSLGWKAQLQRSRFVVLLLAVSLAKLCENWHHAPRSGLQFAKTCLSQEKIQE